jgi:broad specificity phosphatase PhoE
MATVIASCMSGGPILTEHDPTMLTVWLVRHGETDSNVEGIFQGHLDVPLNARGECQARAVAERLAGVRFDAVYASDLRRAAHTAELVATPHGLPVTLDRDLRERHYGTLQGARYDQARELLAAFGATSAGEGGVGSATLPGGEPLVALRRRAKSFARRLRETHAPDAGQTVLVVSHGGLLRVLLTVLLDLPASARQRFAFSNCGVSRVSLSDRSAVLDIHNLTDGSGTL